MSKNAQKLYLSCRDELNIASPELGRAISDLRIYSTYGTKMLDFLQDTKIPIILDDTLGDLSGVMNFDGNGPKEILLNPNMPHLFASTLIHEAYHAKQCENGLFAMSYKQSFGDIALQLNLWEAGAYAYAGICTYEMKLNGHSESYRNQFNNMAQLKHNSEIMREIDRTFKSCTAQGADAKTSLIKAGQSAFSHYFKCTHLTEIYMESTLKQITEMFPMYARYKGAHRIDNKSAEKFGMIDQNVTLGADIDLGNALDALAAANPDFIHALNWLNHIRLVQYHQNNPDHFNVILSRQELDRQNNPYRDIDYDDYETAILKNLDWPKRGQDSLLVVLNKLSGDQKVFQKHFDFSKAFPSKRSNG